MSGKRPSPVARLQIPDYIRAWKPFAQLLDVIEAGAALAAAAEHVYGYEIMEALKHYQRAVAALPDPEADHG